MAKEIQEINKLFQYSLIVMFFFGFLYNYLIDDWYSVIVTLISPIVVFMPQILKWFKLKIPDDYVFMYLILVFAGLFIGETVGVYIFTYWYDKLVHGFSGILLFVLGLAITYKRFGYAHIKNNFWKVFIYCLFFALLIELVWETIEVSNDFFIGTNMTQDGLRDTTLDLTMTILGSTFAGILTYINIHVRKVWFIDQYIKELAKKE